jgi:acyl carrier protein
VKIRGYRVELGEVESALLEHAAVKQAVVVASEDGAGSKRLIAYIVPRESVTEAARQRLVAQLRDEVRARLPAHFIPSLIIVLDSFPLTPNGKIDREKLQLGHSLRDLAQEYVAPRNEIEAELAKIWAEALLVDRVGMEDDFFELGGHSLLATRIISRVRDGFCVEMPLEAVFEAPTVSRFAIRLVAEILEGQTELDVMQALTAVSHSDAETNGGIDVRS